MENKKSRKANLETSKIMFLLVGLIIAIAFVVSAFQWQSEKVLPVMTTTTIEPDDGVITIVTKNDYFEKTEKKAKQEIKQEKKAIIDKIIISNSHKKVSDIVTIPKPILVDSIIEIIEEPKDKIWEWTSTPPKFRGGIIALRRWIGSHVNYPAVARENGIQGTVHLRFEVTKTGKIGKIELQKGVDALIDEEAIKVIGMLPNFKPGKHNGAAVNVWFSIPISFKLN